MSFKKYIKENIDFKDIKKGEFHKWCIKNGYIKTMDDEIPSKAIEAGLKDEDEHVRKMAQFAKNMKNVHK